MPSRPRSGSPRGKICKLTTQPSLSPSSSTNSRDLSPSTRKLTRALQKSAASPLPHTKEDLLTYIHETLKGSSTTAKNGTAKSRRVAPRTQALTSNTWGYQNYPISPPPSSPEGSQNGFNGTINTPGPTPAHIRVPEVRTAPPTPPPQAAPVVTSSNPKPPKTKPHPRKLNSPPKALPARPKDEIKYIQSKIAALLPTHIPYREGHDSTSTARYYTFNISKKRKQLPFNVGIEGLHGCTCVVIHSSNGVFFSHIFETEFWDGSGSEFVIKELEKSLGKLKGEGVEKLKVYILTPTWSDQKVSDPEAKQKEREGRRKEREKESKNIGKSKGKKEFDPNSSEESVQSRAGGYVSGKIQYQKQIDSLKGVLKKMCGGRVAIFVYEPINWDFDVEKEELKGNVNGRVLVEWLGSEGVRVWFEQWWVDVDTMNE